MEILLRAMPCAVYHLWALIGTGNIFRHTADRAWLAQIWSGHAKAVGASLAKVNRTSGLMVVDQAADWARGGQGGQNIAGATQAHYETFFEIRASPSLAYERPLL